MGCTKLYSKLHVVYLGSVNGMLFLHHPDTARIFFGSGNACVRIKSLGVFCICVYAVCKYARAFPCTTHAADKVCN